MFFKHTNFKAKTLLKKQNSVIIERNKIYAEIKDNKRLCI